jgi:hypothetical protein
MTGMGKYQDFVASHSNEEYLMGIDGNGPFPMDLSPYN